MKTGKRYAELVKLVDKSTLYDPSDAAKLVCETGKAKFDETVELHVRLGVDSRHADQQLAKGPKADEAKEAGAEFVGDDDMIDKIQKENWFDFDVIIATPDMMGKLGRLGKVLGPKGLMPNPKAGTVTMDVTKAVNEVKAGKIEYRLDKSNIIHCPVGKVSFGPEKIEENVKALMEAIIKAKPAAAKGQYIKSCSLAATMGPGIKVNATKFS